MAIQLDHFIVPCRHPIAAARQLAELLGVTWAETALGPFSPVFINEGLTLDFQHTDEDFPVHHYCFRVSDAEFDAILARIEVAGIPYRSLVRGPVDRRVDTQELATFLQQRYGDTIDASEATEIVTPNGKYYGFRDF